MPILPGSSLLTFTFSSSSFDTYVDEVTLEWALEPFTRQEFLYERLREAAITDGTRPIINNNIANTPHQFGASCTGDVPRPLGPNNTTSLNNAYQRFNILRYNIKGAPTVNAPALVQLYGRHYTHIRLLNKFQYHLAKGAADLDYTSLVALQAETFSYLTSTSTTMTGASVGGAVSNILITSFQTDVAYEATDGSGELLQAWSMVAEVRAIESQSVG